MDNRIYVIILVFLLLGGVGLSFLGLLDSPEQPAEVIEERNVVSINQGEVVDINRADVVVDEPEPVVEPEPEPECVTEELVDEVFSIKSDCFKDGERIPVRFTCDGIDISPHLAWFNVPLGTVELALEMHDPDAPVSGGWTHWIVYNIGPDITSIEIDSVPEGSKEARNSFGRAPYGGPCPPSGTHRYIFTLYALDVQLDSVSNLRDLHNKIDGHVLGEAKLTGLYSRR